jgi:hypothetical protein
MDKKPYGLDPDFIARPATPANSPNSLMHRQPSHLPAVPDQPSVPAMFDPVRIQQELQKLAGTPMFFKYIAVLKGRFARAAERAALEHWEKFYASAQKTVQAHTELVRAQHDHQQVEREYEIKNKQKDLASLSLDADIEEQHLRIEAARAARREFEQAVNQPAASVRGVQETAMLDQWYQQSRRLIMEDQTLSIDEQDYFLDQLKAEYRARKQTIDIG